MPHTPLRVGVRASGPLPARPQAPRAWRHLAAIAVVALLLGPGGAVHGQGPASPPAAPAVDDGFRFRGAVELINVTATVYDRNDRFVPDLTLDDFTIYDDNQPQTISHFSNERVPVSLGIVLDTSGSMAGEKIESARRALDRFLRTLLVDNDEVFLFRFSDTPALVQDWTRDRSLVARALGRIAPQGGTALYDAVAEALPLAQGGGHRKKALLVISDGNDTASRTTLRELRDQIHQSEVLVYAIGIDGESAPAFTAPPRAPFPPVRRPFPPIGGRRGWPRFSPQIGFPRPVPPRRPRQIISDERVNRDVLRELTDDSGGRTEIIRSASDLDPATAGIADELSRQYFMGYEADGKKDGKYHRIRVEVRDRTYTVRARRGYVAN